MTNRVYLAGPIGNVDYKGATEWRKFAQGYLETIGIEAFSPMRGKEFLSSVEGNIGYQAYNENALATEAAVLMRDTNDVRRCDVLLANVLGAEKAGGGTFMECGMAHILQKPIIWVVEPEGNPFDHMMLRRAAGVRVETLDEALDIIRILLKP